MDFVAVVDQVIALLRQRGRVTYRTLKRQFQLDDDALEDLKDELIEGQRLAVDEDGRRPGLDRRGGRRPLPAAPAAARTGTPRLHPTLSRGEDPHLPQCPGRRAQAGHRAVCRPQRLHGTASRDLDPEAAQQLLDPALHRMMDAVHRYEGTVNQVLGDGIMALFGAPIAHEDHALRACYAALAMQAAMQPLYRGGAPHPRPGAAHARRASTPARWWCGPLATTCTWTTRRWGRPRTWRRAWNRLATPGSIRLTAATLRLVEGLVQVNALGPVPVKGLAEPVEVFELVGASALRRRLQAAAARGLTRFVGRQPELEALQQALAQAQAGHGQVVAAGGGGRAWGSRAWSMSVVHSHHTQGWRVLESASVSYGKATPYFPVIDLLKRYCHVEERDDPRTIRAKVTGQVLTLDEALQETLPALLALLDALPEDSPFLHARPAAAAPAHARRRSSACCCAKARCSRCCWSLKTCTGSMPRRRPCSTAWSRACPRPACCCWSTTARSTSTAGAARPTTRNCGSTRCPRPAPTSSSRPCWGTTPAWRRSRSS